MATKWLGAAPALFLLVAGAGLTSGAACGETVATCESDCALPDAPEQCLSACMAAQSNCITDGCSADFQWYLTCIGNTGTYRAVDDRCAAAAAKARVDASSLQPVVDGGMTSSGDSSTPTPDTGTPPLDTGTSALDTGTPPGDCAAATCAQVCSTEGPNAAMCTTGCEASQANCSALPTEYQAFLTCICQNGGVSKVTGQASGVCNPQVQALAPCLMMTAVSDGGIGGR